jgi:hypothetical protein
MATRNRARTWTLLLPPSLPPFPVTRRVLHTSTYTAARTAGRQQSTPAAAAGDLERKRRRRPAARDKTSDSEEEEEEEEKTEA